MSEVPFEWAEVVAASSPVHPLLTYAEMRAAIPIGFILEHYGIEYEVGSTGLSAICPLHAESRPSFSVFGENLERWICFGCQSQGDVIDFVSQYEKCSPSKALTSLAALVEEASTWAGPSRGQQRIPLDVPKVIDTCTKASTSTSWPLLDELIRDRGWAFTSEWVHNSFKVGEVDQQIIIPYITRDGELVTYKHRTPSTKPYSMTGSSFADVLYNELQDDFTKEVLLVGSESDAWVAQWFHGSHFSILGAPTGETAPPKQAVKLAGRNVTICFDGDDAGRKGAQAWSSALLKLGCVVTVLNLPDGEDVASLGDLTMVMLQAQSVNTALPPGIKVTETGYTNDGRFLSNWVFTPQKCLTSDEGDVYSGVLEPGNELATIAAADFKSRGGLVKWSVVRGRSWYGTDREAQLILGYLQASKSQLSVSKATSLAGLMDSTFVWSGGQIGPEPYEYQTPPARPAYDIKLFEGAWDIQDLLLLRKLHIPEVVDPILAWLAIAPLRSKLEEFPLLAVMGTAGTGKTTLLETLVPWITGSLIRTTLTVSTIYGANSILTNTNAWPVHIDEINEANREETLRAVEQMLRDAYNKKSSVRGGGGGGNNWATLKEYTLIAPIALSGETAFTEQSHLERMIYIPMPESGTSPAALRSVRERNPSSFAYAYLSWLSEQLQLGRISLTRQLRGPGDLPERMQVNMGVLEAGWSLLRNFAIDHGVVLSDPHFDRLTKDLRANAGTSSIDQGIHWAASHGFGVDVKGAEVIVDIPTLTTHLSAHGFKLTGNIQAIAQHLRMKYGATTVDPSGLRLRYTRK